MSILPGIISDLAEDAELSGPNGACPMMSEPGNDRFLVITGENAGGKTFYGSIINGWARDRMDDLEVMDVTMRRRSEGGFARAFIFGDESWESTGQISIKAVLGGLSTCASRTKPHMLILDEPDIGLSEGYQAALGERFAQFAANLPEHTVAFVVVTHSRLMVEKMLAANPTLMRVGDDLRPTREWLVEGPLPRTAEDLDGLQSRSRERFKLVTELIRKRREDNEDKQAAKGTPRR